MINTNRKFKFALVAFTVGVVALFLDKLSGEQYVALVTLILGVYTAGNVTQKRTQGRDDD